MPTPTDFQPLEYHPLANLFPMMDDAALRELADDIRANGVHDAIVLHEGKILEGRNRHAACMIAGVEPADFCKPFDSQSMGDPLAFVISRNLFRRHLTESQRAMIAAKLATFTHGGDRRTDQPATGQLARRTAAAALNVSERSVARAAVVRNQGAPELIAAVEAGDIPVSVAANLARPPQPRAPEPDPEPTVIETASGPLARTAHLDPYGRMTVPEYLEPPANRVPPARAATRTAPRAPMPAPVEPEPIVWPEDTSDYSHFCSFCCEDRETIADADAVNENYGAHDGRASFPRICKDCARKALRIINPPRPAAEADGAQQCTFCGQREGVDRLLVDVGPNGDRYICEDCSDDAAGQFFHARNPRLEWVESPSDFPDHPIRRSTENTDDDPHYEIAPMTFRRGAQAFHHYRIVYFDDGEIGEAATFAEAAAKAQRHADILALGDPDATLDRWAIWGD